LTMSKIASSRCLGTDVSREPSADSQVRRVALRLRDQRSMRLPEHDRGRTGRSLPVARQLQANGLPEIRTDVFGMISRGLRKVCGPGRCSRGRRAAATPSACRRQSIQTAHHQIDDVVPVLIRVDAVRGPRTIGVLVIEREPSVFGQRGKNWSHEETDCGRLPVHQLSERGGARQDAAERIRNELPHVYARERAARSRARRSRVPDGFELARQRMRCRDSLSRYAPISTQVGTPGGVSRSSSRSSVAAASHCRSSKKSASGCSCRANTPMNRWNTTWKRRRASWEESSGTGGWSPMMSFNPEPGRS